MFPFYPQTLKTSPVPSFILSLIWHPSITHRYLSIFICPSFSPSPSLCCFPFLFTRLFPSSLFHFLPPTCGFALHPSVLFPSLPSSLSSSSVIPRSHMVSLSGSVCVWCYPEFSGAPCLYVCVFCRRRERWVRACACVYIEFSRLCNSLIWGSFIETSPS